MTLDKMQQMIGSLAKQVEDNEKLSTAFLASKLNKAQTAYPEDQTIGVMSRVINKMAANNTAFIRRADLKQLYTKLFSRNTKFAEIFSQELGPMPALSGAKTMPRDDAAEINPYQVGDQTLATTLKNALDPQFPVKMYSRAAVEQAKRSVNSTLDAWNLRPSKLEVSNGNDKLLMMRADYETPKGAVSICVPVEVQNNKVSQATIFIGKNGPQALNHTELKGYISDFFNTQTKVATANYHELELPAAPDMETFERKFAAPHGQAELQFGSEVVKTAREHLVRELNGFGYRHPQVSVHKFDEQTIFYSVALNAGRLGFTVPVKITNGKVIKPTVVLCNGSVSSFSQDGINRLTSNDQNDYQAAAVASPQYQLKPSDLLNSIRKALAEENLSAAEDALNVLSHSGNPTAYAAGLQLYMDGLSFKKEAAAPTQCSMMLKNSTSQHFICGHTGLPVNKVYQDKEGNCRPLYRRGMDETYEAPTFNNSKIFG